MLPRAVEIAAELAGKADPVLGRLKADLYPGVLEALGAKLAP